MHPNLCIFILACGLLSFSGKEDKPYKFNDLKKIEKSLSLIPKGTLHYGSDVDRRNILALISPKPIIVDSFYIYKFEVSNGLYMNFVNDLKKKNFALYTQMLPDTLVWLTNVSYCEPYMYHYYRHPAFRDYPVVGISYKQAQYFCAWLTEAYMKDEKRKFKKVAFKLPSADQWTYAAKGGENHFTFPWGGPNMQDKKGQWLANFRVIPQDNIRKETMPIKNENKSMLIANGKVIIKEGNSSANDMGILNPVLSYNPNNYGLYNMAGNAEEYVIEKGISKGGSWLDTGYYLQTDVIEKYDSTNYVSVERGFRFIMTIIK